MKYFIILFIHFIYIVPVGAQTNTSNPPAYADASTREAKLKKCNAIVWESSLLEAQLMKLMDKKYQYASDFYQFLEEQILKNNIASIDNIKPFSEIESQCNCETEVVQLMKDVLKNYKKLSADDYICKGSKSRIDHILKLEQVINAHGK